MTDDLSKECRRLDDSYLKWYRKHFNEVINNWGEGEAESIICFIVICREILYCIN